MIEFFLQGLSQVNGLVLGFFIGFIIFKRILLMSLFCKLCGFIGNIPGIVMVEISSIWRYIETRRRAFTLREAIIHRQALASRAYTVVALQRAQQEK